MGVSLDDPLDSVPGDSLSRLPFVLFSMLANSFGLGESDPMALHVCANNASGLVLESNVFGSGDKYSGRMYWLLDVNIVAAVDFVISRSDRLVSSCLVRENFLTLSACFRAGVGVVINALIRDTASE